MKDNQTVQSITIEPDNVLMSFSTNWKASILQLFDILKISSPVSFGLLSRFADHSHDRLFAGSATQMVGISMWLQFSSIVFMKWLAACLAAAFSIPSKLIELTNVRLPTIDLKTWWLGRPQDRRVNDMAVRVTCGVQEGRYLMFCYPHQLASPVIMHEGERTSQQAQSSSASLSEYSTEKNFVLPWPRTFVRAACVPVCRCRCAGALHFCHLCAILLPISVYCRSLQNVPISMYKLTNVSKCTSCS